MKHLLVPLALAVAIVSVVVVGACDLGGNEGDRCNPLVLQDECNAGLHCRVATCSAAYCCPTNRASTDPNCNAPGCPDSDAGADASADAPSDGASAD